MLQRKVGDSNPSRGATGSACTALPRPGHPPSDVLPSLRLSRYRPLPRRGPAALRGAGLGLRSPAPARRRPRGGATSAGPALQEVPLPPFPHPRGNRETTPGARAWPRRARRLSALFDRSPAGRRAVAAVEHRAPPWSRTRPSARLRRRLPETFGANTAEGSGLPPIGPGYSVVSERRSLARIIGPSARRPGEKLAVRRPGDPLACPVAPWLPPWAAFVPPACTRLGGFVPPGEGAWGRGGTGCVPFVLPRRYIGGTWRGRRGLAGGRRRYRGERVQLPGVVQPEAPQAPTHRAPPRVDGRAASSALDSPPA